ncbi:MAG: DUF2304 family protein [Methanobacteriaceae archaeon]|jgi:hypothetical protein|nr:DUF2304 family protein [Methanobacteriaceae archaeon]
MNGTPLYPLTFIIIAILAIAIIYLKFREKKISLTSFILWIFLWVMIVIIAIDPKFSEIFARIFGISRGLDAIFIMAIISLLYMCFKLFLKIEKLEQNINKLVRELAIKNEINLENEEDKD